MNVPLFIAIITIAYDSGNVTEIQKDEIDETVKKQEIFSF